MSAKPQTRGRKFLRRFLLTLLGVAVVLLALLTWITAPDQFRTIDRPDLAALAKSPPAPIAVAKPAAGVDSPKTEARETSGAAALLELDLEAPAALWIVNRAAFRPVADVDALPAELQVAARKWNEEVDALVAELQSILARAATEYKSWNYPPGPRFDGLVSSMHLKSRSAIARQRQVVTAADASLRLTNEQVWNDAADRAIATLCVLADLPPDAIQNHYSAEDKLDSTTEPMDEVIEPPERIIQAISRWDAAVAECAAELLALRRTSRQNTYWDFHRAQEQINRRMRRAMAELLKTIGEDKEWLVLPDGLFAWRGLRGHVLRSDSIERGYWEDAAWISHDMLGDREAWVYCLRRAGLPGRWRLMTETLEDFASDAGERLSDVFRRRR